MTQHLFDTKLARTHNSTYPKLAVKWLNQALYIIQSLCIFDSEALRRRQLWVAANRYTQLLELVASG